MRPKSTPSRGPIRKPITCFIPGPVRPMVLNCIRIRSIVFPQCTGQTDRPTHRQIVHGKVWRAPRATLPKINSCFWEDSHTFVVDELIKYWNINEHLLANYIQYNSIFGTTANLSENFKLYSSCLSIMYYANYAIVHARGVRNLLVNFEISTETALGIG